MKKKLALAGLIILLVAGGLVLAGCEKEAESGGTLTVTNTSSDQYDLIFCDTRGNVIQQSMLFGYRSMTFEGNDDGVYELRYRKGDSSRDWVTKYGNLSGGQKSTMNIP